MAFNIIISEDPNYSEDILKNSTKIKVSIKVLSFLGLREGSSKTIIEFDKTFPSIDVLNKILRGINPYGASEVLIYLELSAFLNDQWTEFVSIGDLKALPLLQVALEAGFETDTYHGNPVFPYSSKQVEVKEVVKEVSEDIQLELITKKGFESALKKEYEVDAPSLTIEEVTLNIDELTAQYNKIGAAISAYKKQANSYLSFDEFDKITNAFSKKYYNSLNDIIKMLNDTTSTVLDNAAINIQIDSDISTRYKAMVSAKVQLERLMKVLNEQGFNPESGAESQLNS